MKASEFCYWLQGYFEIGNVLTLDVNQTKVILKHLELVFAYDKDAKGDAIGFCQWLNGVLEFRDILSTDVCNRVEAKLSDVFEHEIDKSYGNAQKQSQLNSIHNKSNPDRKMKC